VHSTNHSVEQSGMKKNENRSVVDMQGHTQHLQRGWKWMDRRENKKRKKKLTLMSMIRLDWGVRRLMFIVFMR
jgi:hypothetical protein